MADWKPIKINAGELERFSTGDTVGIDHGGTGATTASGARTNLGLAIGTNVQAWDADLDALAALSSTGIIVRTGTNTYSLRAVAGTAGRITVTNGDGVAGNPTFDLATVTDAGTGTFLKITRDTYGRVSGTTAVTTADITTLVDATYVNVSGDTMTGYLTLHANPTNSLHAATKDYVDTLFASGGVPPFAPVRVKTTGNITLSGTQTIDGVAAIVGDRVLVSNQSTASQNGIYVVAAGAWARATDADQSAEYHPARVVFVQEGTAYGNTAWAVSNAIAPVINTDPITFVQVSGSQAYTGGNGINVTGNVITAVGVAGQITVTGGGIGLATSGVGAGGTYTKVTVDTYGRVTVGATATPGDIGAQPLDATLTALAAFNSNGLLTQTAADTFVARTLTGTAGRITVTNGNGVAGNPTVDLASGVIASPGTYNSVTVDTYGRVTAGSIVSTSVMNEVLTNGSGSTVNICRAVYITNNNTFSPANANNVNSKNVVGLVNVTSIANAASGNVAVSGIMEATTGQWDAVTGQTGGLTYGAIYYLSNATAGALTTTAPGSGYVAPIGIALSTTKIKINIGQTVFMGT